MRKLTTLEFTQLVRNTDGAYLFLWDEHDGHESWVPMSVCTDLDKTAKTIEVETWFVEKEGLEDYAV